jgi:hypothetical protein
MVNVVVALTATEVVPLTATETPLIVVLTALVVCHVTTALLPCSAAWIAAVGAGVEDTVTVALAVAVAPAAFLATIVKVVVPLTGTVVVPFTATVWPLIVADTALVVCHVTTALLPCRVAWIAAVGGGDVVPTLIVASFDEGPSWYEAS